MSNERAIGVGCQLNAWQRELDLHAPTWEKLDAVLAQVAEAGYAGAEVPHWSVPDLSQPTRLYDLVARHGEVLVSLHAGGVFYDATIYREQTVPRLRAVAECAAAAGAAALVISNTSKHFDGPPPGLRERGIVAHWRTQARNLAEFARLVGDLGLLPWVHNHAVQFEHDAAEMESILEMTAAPLGICVDVGHAYQAMPGEPLLAWLRRHWDYIACLHYKDVHAGQIVEALGDGEVDFVGITAIALERQWHGWIVAELEAASDIGARRAPLDDARRSCELIRRTLLR